MVAAAAFFFQINTGNNGVDAFPEGSFTRDAFFILEEEGFSFGVIKPTQIVIDGNVDSPEVQGAIEKLTTSIESDPRFPLPPALEVFAEANLAVLSVLIAGEPRSQSAADAVTAIREQHIPGAFNGVPAEAIVGGLSAADADFRGFHRHSAMILQAFAAGVLVEGFTTNIARSFIITGRLRDQGVRRLQNNNRHVMEIFWPEGLERHGDGWKLSVRIRLVHAQVRRLLRQSPDWEAEAWGDPISAAHLAFAASSFSARLLKHSRRIGVPFSEEESASFMMIWLYSAYLMGIPEAILPRSEAEALHLYDVARVCEPYPDFESIIMANALISSVPLLVGLKMDGEGEELRKMAYTVARAFIGDDLADQLKFPPAKTRGIIKQMWLNTKLKRFKRKVVPGKARRDRFNNFSNLVTVSVCDDYISYKLPDHAYSERSERW